MIQEHHGSTDDTGAALPCMVECDVGRKILRTRFRGIVRPEHVTLGVHHLQKQLPKLGSGFVLVTDLSDLESMEIDCVAGVARMMDICFAAGLARVIRIIPDPEKDIGFNLLALVHYRRRIPTLTCKTREEAEKELARL
jgi:hypothetical protein